MMAFVEIPINFPDKPVVLGGMNPAPTKQRGTAQTGVATGEAGRKPLHKFGSDPAFEPMDAATSGHAPDRSRSFGRYYQVRCPICLGWFSGYMVACLECGLPQEVLE